MFLLMMNMTPSIVLQLAASIELGTNILIDTVFVAFAVAIIAAVFYGIGYVHDATTAAAVKQQVTSTRSIVNDAFADVVGDMTALVTANKQIVEQLALAKKEEAAVSA